MRRREFLLAGAASLASIWPAHAVRAATAKRVLMVTWRGETAVERGFRDYLMRRGAAVELIARDAARDPRRLDAIAREIVVLRPDLVYLWGTSATLGVVGRHDAPNAAIGDVPAVFALVADAVGAGIVPRLEGQMRAVTGVGHVAPIAAQLEAIRRYRPFGKLGVLYNPLEANSLSNLRDLRAQGAARGFVLLEQSFDRSADGKPSAAGIADKVRALRRAGAEWLYLGPDTYLFTQLPAVTAAARDVGLPTFAATEALIAAPDDVLVGLVAPYHAVGVFAAHKAMQILFEGRRAADIPVETLKRFSLVVRMDVAKKINLPPPLEFYDYAEFWSSGRGA